MQKFRSSIFSDRCNHWGRRRRREQHTSMRPSPLSLYLCYFALDLGSSLRSVSHRNLFWLPRWITLTQNKHRSIHMGNILIVELLLCSISFHIHRWTFPSRSLSFYCGDLDEHRRVSRQRVREKSLDKADGLRYSRKDDSPSAHLPKRINEEAQNLSPVKVKGAFSLVRSPHTSIAADFDLSRSETRTEIYDEMSITVRCSLNSSSLLV